MPENSFWDGNVTLPAGLRYAAVIIYPVRRGVNTLTGHERQESWPKKKGPPHKGYAKGLKWH